MGPDGLVFGEGRKGPWVAISASPSIVTIRRRGGHRKLNRVFGGGGKSGCGEKKGTKRTDGDGNGKRESEKKRSRKKDDLYYSSVLGLEN